LEIKFITRNIYYFSGDYSNENNSYKSLVMVHFLFFGGCGMAGGIMNGGMHSGMSGWVSVLDEVSCYKYSHSWFRSGLEAFIKKN
jgi:hypothetical protein